MPYTRACLIVALALAVSAARAEDDYIAAGPLSDIGLAKFWQMQLTLEIDQRILDAYLVDDQIYACTNDGFVFAVHADTGALRWMRQVTRSGYRLKHPCHAGGRTIFVTPTRVLELERITGEPLAEGDFAFAVGTGVVSDGDLFYIGALNQRFYGFGVRDHTEVWKAGTSGAITSTPALYRESLFVASEDGGVYACVAKTKRAQWQSRTNGPNTADLVADANGVFVASRDQSLYLIDFEYGQSRWRVRFSGPLYEPPVLTTELAYQFCPDDGVLAIETDVLKEEQRVRWKAPRGRALLTVDERYAYMLTQDERIETLALGDGAMAGGVSALGFTLPLPSPGETAVFVANPDGRLFAARPKGVPFPRRDAIRKALLPKPPVNAPSTQPASSQPAVAKPAARGEPDYLSSGPGGAPSGGKSKVTREFGSGGGGASRGRSPTTKPADTQPSDN